MKICHFTSAHSAEDTRIFEKECLSLVNSGNEVFLVVNGEYAQKKGVHIIGVEFTKTGRLYRMTSFAKKIYKTAKSIDADIYHFHDPELIPYGLKLKKIGKKVIFDVHEDYYLDILSKTWIPKCLRKIVSNKYRKYEEKSASRLDGIIAVNEEIANRFIGRCDNVVVVSNYPIVNNIKEKNFKEKDNINICFAGTIAENRLHHKIIDAISEIDNARYLLAGSGTETYMEKLKKIKGFDKVKIYGYLSQDEVKLLYDESYIGIVLEEYNLGNYGKKGSLGTVKIFEYMMAGLPVICNDFDAYLKIKSKYNFCICVNPYKKNEIVDAIQYLANNKEIAKAMGREGQKAVLEQFNWGVEEKKLIQLYDKVK